MCNRVGEIEATETIKLAKDGVYSTSGQTA